jgi:hypothetical protein
MLSKKCVNPEVELLSTSKSREELLRRNTLPVIIQRHPLLRDKDLRDCALELNFEAARARMTLRCFVSLGDDLELNTAPAFPQRYTGHARSTSGGHNDTHVPSAGQVRRTDPAPA